MFRDRFLHGSGRWHRFDDIVQGLPVGPAISNVVVTPSDTSASIAWDVSPNATGQVFYGPSIAYGSETTRENSFDYSSHSQSMVNLIENTTYYYRIESVGANGGQSEYESSFSTTGAPSVASNFYGVAMQGTQKGNAEIGRGWGDIAFRFRAHASSAPVSVGWANRRGSGGYSDGTPTIRIGIQGDDGTANHYPDGTWLTYTDEVLTDDSSGDERWLVTNFTGAPALTNGQLYHVVFENVSSNPYTDWTSLNCLETYTTAGDTDGAGWAGPTGTLQPYFPDTDLAYHREGPDNWTIYAGAGWGHFKTPHFDLKLADNSHEGQMYCLGDRYYDRKISGTSQMVRARFTVSGGNRTATGAWWFLGRESGSGDVTIKLQNSGGTLIDSVTVTNASSIPYSPANQLPGDPRWVGGNFGSNQTLVNGTTYNLEVSCPSGSVYWTRPLFWEERSFDDQSRDAYRFLDGVGLPTQGSGQFTTNGGSNWYYMYTSNVGHDAQFYFTTE